MYTWPWNKSLKRLHTFYLHFTANIKSADIIAVPFTEWTFRSLIMPHRSCRRSCRERNVGHRESRPSGDKDMDACKSGYSRPTHTKLTSTVGGMTAWWLSNGLGYNVVMKLSARYCSVLVATASAAQVILCYAYCCTWKHLARRSTSWRNVNKVAWFVI